MDIEITTEYIKLDQLLKFAGLAGSGADAKFFIKNGEITLNGTVVTERGKKIRSGDIIKFGEQEVYVR